MRLLCFVILVQVMTQLKFSCPPLPHPPSPGALLTARCIFSLQSSRRFIVPPLGAYCRATTPPGIKLAIVSFFRWRTASKSQSFSRWVVEYIPQGSEYLISRNRSVHQENGSVTLCETVKNGLLFYLWPRNNNLSRSFMLFSSRSNCDAVATEEIRSVPLRRRQIQFQQSTNAHINRTRPRKLRARIPARHIYSPISRPIDSVDAGRLR